MRLANSTNHFQMKANEMEYKVLTSDLAGGLEDKVNLYLSNGFKLVGAATLSMIYSSQYNRVVKLYTQTLIKRNG